MAYDNLVDPETGLFVGTVEDGKIIDADGVEIGVVRDGVVYSTSGERWRPLSDARAGVGSSPMPDAMRQALGLK